MGGSSRLDEIGRTCVDAAGSNPGLLVKPLSLSAPSNEAVVPQWPHILPSAPKSISQIPKKHTHTHTWTEMFTHSQVPSSLRAPTATRQCFPIHPTCFGSLPSFQSVLSNGHAEIYLNPRAVGEDTSSGMCRGHLRLPWIVHTQVGVHFNLFERV